MKKNPTVFKQVTGRQEDWIDNADEWRELKISLTRESFRKLYAISVEKKKTMDDVIAELIDDYGK